MQRRSSSNGLVSRAAALLVGIAVVTAAFAAPAVAASGSPRARDRVDSVAATTVAVGRYPSSVSVDPATHTAYVLNSGNGQAVNGNGTLSIVQGSAVQTIKVGGTPVASAVDPTPGTLYLLVANTTDHLVEMDGTTVTRRIPLDTPIAVEVDPATHVVYVLLATHKLAEIDGKKVTIVDVAGAFPDRLAFDPGTGTAYVLSADGVVTVVQGTSTRTVHTGPEAMQIAIDTSTHAVFVTHGQHAAKHVVRDARLTILRGGFLATVDLSYWQPTALAVNSTTGTAYVTLASANSTAFGELARVVGTTATIIDVGGHPDAVAVDPTSGTVYVGNESDGTVSVVTGKQVSATVPTGRWPMAIAVDPSTSTAYVANFLGASLTEISPGSG